LKNISGFFFGLPDRDLPGRQVSEQLAYTQSEAFFHLAVAKNARIARLREYFSREGINKVFISANLSGFECRLPGISVEFLEKGFFQETETAARERKQSLLEGAVVVVNNNDVGLQGAMPHYADFYNQCEKTVFVAWDWDNHHWLELSTFLAAHSDLYAPAHHENLYLLSRYNWLTVGPVYCASVQWSRKFLADHLPEMLYAERSSEPLGKHIPYAPFNFRSRVITTLSQHYPSIGFSDRSFHVRTPEERLKEWYSHRVHWIVPVLNDVPIRIFDALVTGGIPIVPESLRFLPPVNAISRDYILFYGPNDIVNPEKLVMRANALFEDGGRDQLVARHRFALEYHHGDCRVRQMLGYVAEALNLKKPVG
jgi:hypothetical protein